MTKDQDTEYVDRIAKFVRDELDMDHSWFIAASGDIYHRMDALRAVDHAEATGTALLHKAQPTRGQTTLQHAHAVLSQCHADYSNPNFTDRYQLAPKIRAVLDEIEVLLWQKGAEPNLTTRLNGLSS